MARFFVNRPIVAMVLSIILVLLGVVAMRGLPIAQYPEIVPPMIQVTTTFIGASATDVEASVATPLEQQTNGVEKGIYMKSININDPIARIPGVGQINLFGGSDYAMRVWLRPDRIGRLGLTVPDIANAIGQQNQLTPAGQIGGAPAAPGTQYTYTVRTQGRLLDEKDFGDIILRTT